MTPPRLVLDANVLLSALLFHAGSSSWLRHAWQSDTIRPLASRDTATELIRVLSYPKFRLTHNEREDLLGDYLSWCEIVLAPNPIEIPGCRDPFGRPFLELALTAGADALLTGDKDLLALAEVFSAPILKLAVFRKRLRGPSIENDTWTPEGNDAGPDALGGVASPGSSSPSAVRKRGAPTSPKGCADRYAVR